MKKEQELTCQHMRRGRSDCSQRTPLRLFSVFGGKWAAFPRRTMNAGPARELGMTLIEIMVVVTIIGLLVAGVSVMAFGRLQKAKLKISATLIKNVESDVETYMMDNNGDCPKTLADLVTQRIRKKEPVDPWGQPLLFTCPGENNSDSVDILSKGPDKKEGTDDDIGNW